MNATILTSICYVYKEKIVKNTHTEERSVNTNSIVAIFNSDRKKIYFIPNISFRNYNHFS